MRYACLEYRILSRIPKPVPPPEWFWEYILIGLL